MFGFKTESEKQSSMFNNDSKNTFGFRSETINQSAENINSFSNNSHMNLLNNTTKIINDLYDNKYEKTSDELNIVNFIDFIKEMNDKDIISYICSDKSDVLIKKYILKNLHVFIKRENIQLLKTQLKSCGKEGILIDML